MKIFTENDNMLIENHIFENAIERVFEAEYYNEDIDANLNTYIEQLETDTVDLQLEENLSGIFEMEYNDIAPIYESSSTMGDDLRNSINQHKRNIELKDAQERDKKYKVGQALPTKKERDRDTAREKATPSKEALKATSDKALKSNKSMRRSYNFARTRDGLGKFDATKRVAKEQKDRVVKGASNLLGKMRERMGNTGLAKKLKNIKGQYDYQRKQDNYGSARTSRMKAISNVGKREVSILKGKAIRGGSMIKQRVKKSIKAVKNIKNYKKK